MMTEETISHAQQRLQGRPWFVESHSNGEYFQVQTRNDMAYRRLICTCRYKEDAELIVKTVNNYEQLIKALEYALSQLEAAGIVCGDVRNAIAKAEGLSPAAAKLAKDLHKPV